MEAQLTEANPEPLLIKSMRAHPDWLVEVVGPFGMKSGTSARGFVAEFDDYIAARETALREEIAAAIEAKCDDDPLAPRYTKSNHAYADAARIARQARP